MEEMISASLLSWVTDANLKAIFSSTIIIILIGIVASGIDFLISNLLITQLNSYFAKSRSYLLQLVVKKYLLNSIAKITIGFVFVFGSFLLAQGAAPVSVSIATIVLKLANIFNICILTLCFNKIISIYHDYYEFKLHHNNRPIESYVKVVNFFAWIITAILIVSYVFDRTPVTILTGIGAVSAFVLLIFKDTFLGIVASVQASATSLVKIGDWIVIDKYNIDGEIFDISINSVKIQNTDNSISTIPTYALTTEAVKNMQPMLSSGARRFKELLYLDVASVKILNRNQVNALIQRYPLATNNKLDLDSKTITNLTIFRSYIKFFLSQYEKINQDYTHCVNTLAPTSNGVPIEIYAYTTGVSYAAHSESKSEVIEYIVAILDDFELAISKNSFNPI